MKRLMTLMLGLAFVVSTVAVSFGQEPTKKEEKKKKKKKGEEEKKKEGGAVR
jgi:hypothetical protein